jgi:ferredoxin
MIMPKIEVEGLKTFDAESGKKLVLAIEDAGIDISHRCGGNARCTTCRVEVLAGTFAPMGEAERERLEREVGLGPNVRLSCQNRVLDGDLKLRVLMRASERGWAPGPRPAD